MYVRLSEIMTRVQKLHLQVTFCTPIYALFPQCQENYTPRPNALYSSNSFGVNHYIIATMTTSLHACELKQPCALIDGLLYCDV